MVIRSIRFRLTLWYTALLTLSLLVLGAVAYILLSFSLTREIDSALTGVARVLAERSKTPATLIPSEIDEAFRRFFGFSPWQHYFQKLDPLDQSDMQPPTEPMRPPLSRESLINASRGIPSFETVEGLGPYPVRILVYPVQRGGQVRELLQLGMSLQNSIQTRHQFLLIMSAILPAALLLAAGIGYILAKRALLPVDRMVETTRYISGEHLSERLQETGTGDELDRLAQTLNAMLDRLDSTFSQIRRFSADASHELQTPLTIIKGELEVALRAERNPEEYRDVLRSVLEEIDRIAVMVESLLLLGRAEAGLLKMDTQKVLLFDLVDRAFLRLKPLAEARSVQMTIEKLDPAVIDGDTDRLERLIVNLMDNAIKYTSPGGQISIELAENPHGVELRISDTGIGISESEQERVFQPFYRTDQARNISQRGTGLGLAIARSIAVAHGGTISLESAPGQGSTFAVRFPSSPTGS